MLSKEEGLSLFEYGLRLHENIFKDLMIAVADFLYRLYHQLVSTHGLGADKNAAEVMKKLRQFAKDNAESEEMAQCNVHVYFNSLS